MVTPTLCQILQGFSPPLPCTNGTSVFVMLECVNGEWKPKIVAPEATAALVLAAAAALTRDAATAAALAGRCGESTAKRGKGKR